MVAMWKDSIWTHWFCWVYEVVITPLRFPVSFKCRLFPHIFYCESMCIAERSHEKLGQRICGGNNRFVLIESIKSCINPLHISCDMFYENINPVQIPIACHCAGQIILFDEMLSGIIPNQNLHMLIQRTHDHCQLLKGDQTYVTSILSYVY